MKVNPIGSMSVIETTPVAAAATPAPAAAAPAPQGWGEWIAGGLWAIPGVATVADAGFAAGRVVVTTGSAVVMGAYNRVYGAPPIPAVPVRAAEAEDVQPPQALRRRVERIQRPPRAGSAAPARGHQKVTPSQLPLDSAAMAAPPLAELRSPTAYFTLMSTSQFVLVLNDVDRFAVPPRAVMLEFDHLQLIDHTVQALGSRILSELTNLNPSNYKAVIYKKDQQGIDFLLDPSLTIRSYMTEIEGERNDFKCVFVRNTQPRGAFKRIH